MMSEKIDWYLKRMDEMLVMADASQDDQSRTILLRMATDCERLAAIEAVRIATTKK